MQSISKQWAWATKQIIRVYTAYCKIMCRGKVQDWSIIRMCDLLSFNINWFVIQWVWSGKGEGVFSPFVGPWRRAGRRKWSALWWGGVGARAGVGLDAWFPAALLSCLLLPPSVSAGGCMEHWSSWWRPLQWDRHRDTHGENLLLRSYDNIFNQMVIRLLWCH